MMNTLLTVFTMLAMLVASGVPVAAQDSTRDTQKKDRGVVDLLNRILGGKQTIRGHVVAVKDSLLIVRGDDDRTYTVDTAAIDSSTTTKLEPGQAVTVAAASTGQNGVVVASGVEPGKEGAKEFRTVSGTVASVGAATITFTTRDGLEIPIDLSQIVGPPPRVRPNEAALLTYERSRQAGLAPVWIEPAGAAAAGGATEPRAGAGGSASPQGSDPRASGSERLRGYVESIGVSTITLKTDDGRTVVVDTARVSPSDARPGETVTVVGRRGSGDTFEAEQIEKSR
jgi:hypothetical protein